MSTRLSVVMIAKNAADLLSDCLASVAWADEIVILDSGSTDNTVDVARAAGAKVFIDTDWQGYGLQRQRAQWLIYNLFMRRGAQTEKIDAIAEPTAEPNVAPMPPILPIKREWREAVLEAAGGGPGPHLS